MQPKTRIYDTTTVPAKADRIFAEAQAVPIKRRFLATTFAPSFRWLLAAEQNGLLKTEDGYLIII